MNYYDVKLYSPEDVTCVIGGYTLANWDSIAIKRSTARFSVIKGIRGKNTRVFNKDSSATIDISVPVTSEVNSLFTDIHEADITYKTARLEIMIKDGNNGILFSTNDGFIPTYPDITYAEDANNFVWTIQCLSSSGGKGETISLKSMLDNLIG